MHLDLPFYLENQDVERMMGLVVMKENGAERPLSILILTESNINPNNGIFLYFTDMEERNPSLEPIKKGLVKLAFDDCDDATCMVNIVYGIAVTEENKMEDVFELFQTSQNLSLLFTYPNGSHKTVSLPLDSFQRQYKELD